MKLLCALRMLATGLGAASLMAATPAWAAAATKAANPLLAPWAGLYGGVPPFDQVQVAHFAPALEAAMAQSRREIAMITSNPQPPTFDNTILPLERSGQTLERVAQVYSLWAGSKSTPEFQRVQRAMEPRLAAFFDELNHNPRLFKRVHAVQLAADSAGLTPEQKRLVWNYDIEMIRAGAQLSPAAQRRVERINLEMASLTTTFSQNLLADESQQGLVIASEAGLAGLPAAQIEAAGAEAKRRKMTGRWVIANTRSAMEPFLSTASDRALREQAFRLWAGRGDHPNAKDPRHRYDNNGLVKRMLALRAERAALLGFPSYAHWRLANAMAREPDTAMALMQQLWQPATRAAAQDVADMQALAQAEQPGIRLEPWDHRYYAEKLRREKYTFDVEQLSPYLRLENVRSAMFWMAGELYGFRFEPVQGVPVFDPSMSVYQVLDAAGRHVGLWYFDPYARPGKASGAWMSAYRRQQELDGHVSPLVSNNCNFVAAGPGQPVLLSWDDTVTMFHEFGHALHGLLSKVSYRSLASPNSLLDFGEVPSQIHERWVLAPQILRFFVDAKGEPIPEALIDKLKRAKNFNRGFFDTEFLASAIVDMQLHMSQAPVKDLAAVEAALYDAGMPRQIVMRHRIPQFGHLFSGGDGYAAGYYAYQWAEVLDRDAFEAFVETGDLFDKATAQRLAETMLAVGNSVDPGEAFRRFRGRDPKVDATLRAHGFAAPSAAGVASQAP